MTTSTQPSDRSRSRGRRTPLMLALVVCLAFFATVTAAWAYDNVTYVNTNLANPTVFCAGSSPCSYNNRAANHATASSGQYVEVYFYNSSGVRQRYVTGFGDAFARPNGTSLYDQAFCSYGSSVATHLSCTVANG